MNWYPMLLSLGVGIAILGLWTTLLVRGQVPELAAGQRAIRFHIVAEVLTGFMLLAGAFALWAGVAWALPLAGTGLGAALYTTINSPGYYADRGEGSLVVLFIGLAVLVAGGIVVLLLAA